MSKYTEDTLVQQTTSNYLEVQLGWDSVYAYNSEDFGAGSLLGRSSDREVVLTRFLREKLVALNPGLPDAAYDDAVRQITASITSQTLAVTNHEKYELLRDGVQITYRNEKGERDRQRLRVIDFDEPANNHFLCVRELWVRGDLYRRRADIIGFVNGLPLLFIECKNIHKNLKTAFEQNFSDYLDTVPHLFHHNSIVMFGNGEQAKIGSITSRWDHFNEWKRLEKELKRDYHIITADKRLDQVARDFVQHYSTAWETGKAMLVCIDKVTCVRMHKLIDFYWNERIREMDKALAKIPDEQEEQFGRRQLDWMRETRMAVVVSEEQGEVDKFRKWELDIIPHRKLMKDGIDLPEAMREKPKYRNMQTMALDDAFKAEEHPLRVAIVCAMWLTGFDVPSLSTLYLDKPLKAHTLMQAIARANRVNEGKNNGLIVDYCGILKHLRQALATFAGTQPGGGGGETDPARPDEELLADLAEAIALVQTFLDERGVKLDAVIQKTGFDRNAAIVSCKEAANENDESRKRFEVMCREVFKKFKACINVQGINTHRANRDAINIVYKSLQQDRDQADITDIIRQLHMVVNEAIAVRTSAGDYPSTIYDISKIDFDRLRKEFERSPRKNTTVQNLRQAVEQRLQRLLLQNPLRTDFQQHYEQIISEYNREKDRVTIEQTFEALFKLVKGLDVEEHRAVSEGLDEESLAIFDLLRKPDLKAVEIKRIKAVSVQLLEKLKAEIKRVDHWRDKEATRDAIRLAIRDYLWNDATGLPEETFDEDDVEVRADGVFRHFYRAYPTVPSPYFSGQAAHH